ncbi:cytoplasmic protein [Salmonella enterica subsp. enterica serovar Pomona]|nr:cytoplasmic protein [Salmonella enterica subsp. enterica serovar Pomona]EMD3405131.1 cytoplasmic protein [Salmonella enterica]EMD3641687.1 cytoplasmic protein [Salmonella enterica]EMD3733776.1 cytoplasmic protein [Salmonella enterica]EMD3882328.1 cytoplasmic protein [Salmonella enterica]
MLQKKPNPMVKNFNFEYCGFSTFIMPVDGVGGILAKWFSKKHNVSVPTPYTFGQAPIPGVNLYRNTKAKFVMANGGNSLPCAMAKYNAKTGQFIHINSDNKFSPIIRETRVIKK